MRRGTQIQLGELAELPQRVLGRTSGVSLLSLTERATIISSISHPRLPAFYVPVSHTRHPGLAIFDGNSQLLASWPEILALCVCQCERA